MIIARAPLRISFLGGGTDYPEFFEEYGGEVISTAIDKFSYITLNRLLGFFDHSIRLSYSKTELVQTAEDLKHPAVRAALKYVDIPSHVEINCISDLPARTGLGSSGAFVVSLLHALHAFKGNYVSPEKLAAEAIEIERDILKDCVGCQDQYAAAVGGFNVIRFNSRTDIRYEPIVMNSQRKETLNNNLMMFYTGIQRSASEIAKDQVDNTKVNIPYLKDLKSLVSEASQVLQSDKPLSNFGRILDEGWKLKQALSQKITNNTVNEIYTVGKKHGALGGKLLGAGGGGFVLLYVEPENHKAVREALKPFKIVPFKFEESGSQIIYHKSSR
jgi:D-glycero-alpha-D-manno-heptose-7-phosphate kinase